MDENRPMTKRERKEARRLERLASTGSSDNSNLFKWIIILGGSILFIALFGLIVFLIKQDQSKPVVLSSMGHLRGNSAAKVELVEFGDLQCPACRAYEPFVRNAMKDYNGHLKLLFKHFPLTNAHPNAMLAAEAVEAADQQGKFWLLHDALYDNQDQWAELSGADARAKIIDFAKALGMDTDKFKKDLDRGDLKTKINDMENEGIELGVNATPTFYIDNKKLDQNPPNYEDFKKLIGEEIKRVEGK